MRRLILTILAAATIGLVLAPFAGRAQEKVAGRLPTTLPAVVTYKPPTVPEESASTTPVAASGAQASGDAAAEWLIVRRCLAKTKISLTDAIKIAEEKIGAGRVIEAYFKVDNARLLYVVEIVVKSDEHQEVVIDSLDGKIVEMGAPDADDKPLADVEAGLAELSVTVHDALDTASKTLPHARPFDVYTEKKDDALLLIVELLDGADVRRVRIHPTSGLVVSVDPR